MLLEFQREEEQLGGNKLGDVRKANVYLAQKSKY
jgi:hypothetical protein